MSYGIVTYNPATNQLALTPDGAGGIFLQLVTFDSTNPGAAQTFYLPDAAGSTIFAFCISDRYHNANTRNDTNPPSMEALGFNTSGWPYTPAGGFRTTYAVFIK